MTHAYEIRPAAEEEFDEASDWYKDEDPLVRDRFVMSVDAKILAITQRPLMFQVVAGTRVLRAIVDGFPFSIFFALYGDHIVILSIFHNSRNPMIWRGRD